MQSGPPEGGHFEWSELVLVGVVARAHGNRGEVIVNPESDFPEERFQPDRRVFARRRDGRTSALTMATVRFHKRRPVIGFGGVETMNDAEALAGAELRIPESELTAPPAGVFYRHDLVGCDVATTDGRPVGRVKAVDGPLGRSRLVVDRAGREVLIPLIDEICVSVETANRRIVIDPPEGLLELNE